MESKGLVLKSDQVIRCVNFKAFQVFWQDFINTLCDGKEYESIKINMIDFVHLHSQNSGIQSNFKIEMMDCQSTFKM